MDNINPKDIKPGQMLSIKGFVMASQFGGATFFTCKLPDYIVLGEHTLEFVVPEGFNAVASAVAELEEQIEAKKEKHHKELAILQERKAQLLQISYGGAEILDAETKETK